MKCPKCGLINPDSAMRCDCGYNFETKEMDAGPTATASRPATQDGEAVLYDKAEVIDCSERLYRRANGIIRSLTVLGTLFGGGGGGMLGYFSGEEAAGAAIFLGLVGAAIGGYAGREEGKNRAVSLKLQAQNALCYLQTAINTRSK